MIKALSTAEEAGFPFERRRILAEEYLREKWGLIQSMATTSLNSQQIHAQNRTEIKVLPGDTESLVLLNAFDTLWEKFTEMDQVYFKKMWEEGKASANSVYGTDATTFALNAIQRELTGN